MEDQNSYLQKLADQFRQWDAEIDELQGMACMADADARKELLNQIGELCAKKKTAQLKHLQAAGDETWDDMKAGVENSGRNSQARFQTPLPGSNSGYGGGTE